MFRREKEAQCVCGLVGHGGSWRRPGESLKDGTTELENHPLQGLHGGKEGKHNHEHWWGNKEIGRKVLRRADSEDLKAEKDALG